MKDLILEYKEIIEENKSKNKKLKNDLWKKGRKNKVENLIYDSLYLGMSGTKVNEKENKIMKQPIFWELKKEREYNKIEINKNSLNQSVERKKEKDLKELKL